MLFGNLFSPPHLSRPAGVIYPRVEVLSSRVEV